MPLKLYDLPVGRKSAMSLKNPKKSLKKCKSSNFMWLQPVGTKINLNCITVYLCFRSDEQVKL